MDKRIINNLTWLANKAAEIYVYDWHNSNKLKLLKNSQDKFYEAVRENIDLNNITVEDAKELRFKRFSMDNPNLWLFPLWLVPIIPEGMEVTTISGDTIVYHKDNMDNDIRMGCVAYGLIINEDEQSKSNITFYQAWERMRSAFKDTRKEKMDGDIYSAWVANLACYLMDNAQLEHDKANKVARGYIDYAFTIGQYENNNCEERR